MAMAMAGEWWGFGDGNVPNMMKNMAIIIGKMIMNYRIFLATVPYFQTNPNGFYLVIEKKLGFDGDLLVFTWTLIFGGGVR